TSDRALLDGTPAAVPDLVGRAIGPADRAAAASAWTPERRARATEPGRTTPVPESGPINIFLTPTVGRLYFRNPATGWDHQCSATTLASPRGRMILTAGRCLHSGPGGVFMEQLVYVPSHAYGEGPGPVYPLVTFRLHEKWAYEGHRQYNYGFGVLDTGLAHLIGGNHLMWNGGVGWIANVVGYQQVQSTCGTVNVRWVQVFVDRRPEAWCNLGGASYGGPMLRDFNTTTRIGYVNGIVGEISSTGYSRSSYFTDEIWAIWRYVEGL
ncbi:MAG TPA: hypothetical protein VGD67_05215, partial [Pseudonocardiaceae bacterium]